jgi:hypothetical protein
MTILLVRSPQDVKPTERCKRRQVNRGLAYGGGGEARGGVVRLRPRLSLDKVLALAKQGQGEPESGSPMLRFTSQEWIED